MSIRVLLTIAVVFTFSCSGVLSNNIIFNQDTINAWYLSDSNFPEINENYDQSFNNTQSVNLAKALTYETGTMIAYTSEQTGNGDIYLMNADGSSQQRLTDDPAYDAWPTWSPNGQQIAFTSFRNGNADIYVMDVDGSNLRQLTSHIADDFWPEWSPDGTLIVFPSNRDGNLEIYIIRTDGTDLLRLTNSSSHEDFPAWSPDGTRIVFSRTGGNDGTYIMNADGSEEHQLLDIPVLEPAWSPDGTQIAFGSDHEGFRAIYVINADGSDLIRLSSIYAGENCPDWSPDGTQITFASWRDGNGEIYVMNADGSNAQRLTINGYQDEFPAWQPSRMFTRITEGPHVTNSTRSSGVCWVDYNGDNYLDIYETNAQYPADENNCLYENQGDGTFMQIEGLAIVNDNNFSTGAIWGDYDNDDDLDLFVSAHRTHPNLFYINNGEGSFSLNTSVPLDDEVVGSTTASWADYDNDGYLDIFIGNSTYGFEGYPPYRNFLFKNTDGIFSEITSGDIVTRENHTYGATWCDFDNDGDLDLIAPGNPYEADYIDLYRNQGGGNFEYLASSILCQTLGLGSASSWADYDNDGDMDLFVTADWPGPSPLYQNDGSGLFTAVADHGLGLLLDRSINGSWADYDNDGDQDILIWTNIFEFGVSDSDSSLGFLFENNDGVFTRIPDTIIFSDSSMIATVVWGDYDRDGDLDLYVPMFKLNQEGATNFFYENNGNSNNYVTIKCIGTTSNKSAIGARIRIKANIFGYPIWQMRDITSQTQAGTQPPLEAHFGLGDAAIIDSIKVEWPSGMIDILTNVEVNQFLTITETRCGDANDDEAVNIGDVVYLVNLIFHNGPSPVSEVAGDANCDGNINVGDAVYLGNYVFQPDAPKPCAGCL